MKEEPRRQPTASAQSTASPVRIGRRVAVVAALVAAALGGVAVLPPPSGKEGADWLQFLGRFHPVIGHLPIGLLLLLPLLEIAGRFPRWRSLREAAGLVLALAAFGALGTSLAGAALAYSGGYAGELVQRHLASGLWLCVLCFACLILRRGLARVRRRWADAVYGSLVFSTVLLMAVTGHQGGALTHGERYLVERMPEGLRRFLQIEEKPPSLASAGPTDAFYAVHIQPMLDAKCVLCHGPQKIKGGLRLDDYEQLLKGGEHGPVLVPGVAEESELYRRITLPPDHQEFMPTEGKRPLTSDEVVTIEQWIRAGASSEMTVAELQSQGVEVPVSATVVPAAADYRPQLGQIATLERDLGLRLVPVSQTPTDGLILRTVSDPQRIDDAALAKLAPVAALIVDAELAGTRVTDQGLEQLAAFSNLRRLDLAHTPITAAGLASLAPLVRLETLNLTGTKVDDRGVAALRVLPRLTDLFTYGTSVTAMPAGTAPTARDPSGKADAAVKRETPAAADRE